MAAIGLFEIEFLIPSASNLKEKRRVVISLKERIHNRYNVSVAEVGHEDLPGRCHLALVTVCNEKAEAEKRLTSCEKLVLAEPVLSVIDRKLTWL